MRRSRRYALSLELSLISYLRFIVREFNLITPNLLIVYVTRIASPEHSKLARKDEVAASWNMEDVSRDGHNVLVN